MKFWDVIKEVSAQPVRQEAGRLFVLALAGDPDAVARAAAAALGQRREWEGGRVDAAPNTQHPIPHTLPPGPVPEPGTFLFCASPPYSEAEEKRLRFADLLVPLPGGPGPTEFRPADTLQVGRPEELVRSVLAHRPDLRISLARRLPGFRALAAEQIIREVSLVNAEFATVSGVGETIPFLAPLFPAVAGTDILVLTKNQVLMVFRLAAIYGEGLELKTRAREVLPVIAGAFGWRSLARQLLGLLPGGMGLPIRAGIAYSGTYAVGRAAQMVFDQGRRPTRQEMLRIYEEGSHLARGVVAALRDRFGRERGSTPPPALPAPEAAGGPERRHAGEAP